MLIKKKIDVTEQPAEEQVKMLEVLKNRPIEFDSDCPELTNEEMRQFVQISSKKERKKQ